MPVMTPTTHLEVLDAAEHMPLGSVLVVNDFSWEEYELLLQDLDERRNPRLSYDCGRLEVVSTSSHHDRSGWFIDKLIWEFCALRGLTLLGCGHATWKSKQAAKGAEGDLSYYVANEPRVRRKHNITLESDPPPDVVVEIDLTTDSSRKLSIYAGLGVPEVWRYDGHSYHFYRLTDGKYTEVPSSRCLPGLSSPLLLEALASRDTLAPVEVVKVFRRLLKKLKK